MEQWKEFIEGYSVSNLGRIRNDKTKNVRKGIKRRKNLEYLSVAINGQNYDIHRFVAIKFVPNPNKYSIVRHLDGNPINNVYTNLAWGTSKDNAQDALQHGTHTSLNNDGYKKQQNEVLKPSKVKRVSKSGYKGIQTYFSERKKIVLYRVFVNTTTKGSKYFGSFESLEEALKVHQEEYFKIFGVYP